MSASLRVVDLPDGQYRWAADDPRWTERPEGAGPWDPESDGNAEQLGPDPRVRHRFATDIADAVWPVPRGQTPSVDGSPTAVPSVQPDQPTVRNGFGLVAREAPAEIGTSGPGWPPRRESSPDRTARVRRRRRSDDDEFRRTTRAEIFGEEPRYSALFGLTATWYALPAVAYVIWLLVGGGGRLGTVAAQLASSLAWVVAALILSIAVAALLRWAMVGWRALTLSFAAAVIGAGVATIAHTFAV